LFIHSFICSFIHLFVHSFICSFIHLSSRSHADFLLSGLRWFSRIFISIASLKIFENQLLISWYLDILKFSIFNQFACHASMNSRPSVEILDQFHSKNSGERSFFDAFRVAGKTCQPREEPVNQRKETL
jgi:hypothetical protein